MRIYRTTDKIEYKIGELIIKISPLSVADKAFMSELMLKGQQKSDLKTIMEASAFALKACVKEVKGLENGDGSPYELQFDDNGKLIGECVDELLNIEQSTQIISLCSSFLNGVPSQLPDGVMFVENDLKNLKAQGSQS